jgi:hypothetical protein
MKHSINQLLSEMGNFFYGDVFRVSMVELSTVIKVMCQIFNGNLVSF